MRDVRHEWTLIFIKPDGVQRGLSGEILRRFERAGLKIIALKMVHATPEFLERHYPKDDTFLRTLGGKTKEAFEAAGLDVKRETGSDDALATGRAVRGWLIDYVASSPVVAFVLEGIQAVGTARKIVGDTLPFRAAPGTIRGDFSIDSPTVANVQRRPVRNLIHASGTLEEAVREIDLWFRPEELFDYRRADETLIQGHLH